MDVCYLLSKHNKVEKNFYKKKKNCNLLSGCVSEYILLV